MATDSGTTPGGGNHRGFGNGKLAAVIGVVLPLCTYVYSEQQKDIQHRQEVVAEKQRQQDAAAERDRLQALQILDEYRDRRFPSISDGRSAASFDDLKACQFLVSEIGLARWGLIGNQTFDVLSGLITSNLRSSNKQIVCSCEEDVNFLIQSLSNTAQTGSPNKIDESKISNFSITINNNLPDCNKISPQQPNTTQNQPSLSDTIDIAQDQIKKIRVDIDRYSPRPRIYLQIRSVSDLENAKCLQKNLRALGYSVPGIENVGGKSSDKDKRLRYVDTAAKDISDGFKEADIAEEAAKHITMAAEACKVASLTPPSPPLTPAPLPYREGRTRPHHLELWLPTPK